MSDQKSFIDKAMIEMLRTIMLTMFGMQAVFRTKIVGEKTLEIDKTRITIIIEDTTAIMPTTPIGDKSEK